MDELLIAITITSLIIAFIACIEAQSWLNEDEKKNDNNDWTQNHT